MKTLIETITTTIFYLKFKENNENDMAAHAICFDFYYKSSQAASGTHSLALTVKPVILKPLKDSTSSVLHNL